MAKLFITPLAMVGPDGYQQSARDGLPVLAPGVTTIILDFGSGAAISSVLPHVAAPTAARIYRITNDAACHIKAHAAGDSTNATTSNDYYPTEGVSYFVPGATLDKISVIAAA